MFDGRFDPYFYQAFVAAENRAKDVIVSVWLAALASGSAVCLLGAIGLGYLR